MASKSIQILVNEFPAAADSSVVVAKLAGRGLGSSSKYAKKTGRFCYSGVNPSSFQWFNECASGLLLELMQ
jgi:hypothetical protein